MVSLLLLGCPGAQSSSGARRSCESAISFTPSQSAEVKIRGEWNGFAPEALTAASDGSLQFHKTLEPRDYGYVFDVGGVSQLDDSNDYTRWVGGVEYSRLRVPDCRAPLLELENFSALPSGELSVRVHYLDGSEGAGVDAVTATFDGDQVPMVNDGERYTIDRSALPRGKHTLIVSASDKKGRAAEALYLPFWVSPGPFSFTDGPMYFAFTDRFRNGDPSNDRPIPGVDPIANYEGGDFAGITQALNEGYFDALGVKTIWISPVDQNPDDAQPGNFGKLFAGYHGYWPAKPRTVQSRFGDLSSLRALTAAAHARGIRVISDLVLNHTHESHPYYQQHGDEGWFHTSNVCVCSSIPADNCDWETRRLDCWFAPYLPDVNWQNSAVAEQLAEDAIYWLQNADLDGFRVDAVKHFEHAGPRALRGALNEISARTGIEYYLVGETFTGVEGRPLISQYIDRHELSGQFDFPLYWPIVDAFGKGGPLSTLDQAVQQSDTGYPDGAKMSVFIGNHDVVRFISTAANQIEADPVAQAWSSTKPPDHVTSQLAFQRSRDALAFALTQPGVPLIYYGDEVGMPGAGDPDDRRMMRFGTALTSDEAALLAAVQKVGQARGSNRGLRSGARFTLATGNDLYVYQRDDDAEPAVVAFNRGSTSQTATLTLKGKLAASPARPFTDVLSGATATLGGAQASLTLAPQSAAVFVPK